MYFDVLDILVEELQPGAGMEIRSQHSAWGASNARHLYFEDVRFAQISLAKFVYRNGAERIDSATRGEWTVLGSRSEANTAAENDETWLRYLAMFASVLQSHSDWFVVCESDCDQNELLDLRLSPDALARLIDSHRSTGAPISVRVSSL